MGCGGSEENAEEDVQVEQVDESPAPSQASAPAPAPSGVDTSAPASSGVDTNAPAPAEESSAVRLINVELYVQDSSESFCGCIYRCKPEMLFVGLLDHAKKLANWEREWEDIGIALPGVTEPLDMITVNSPLSRYAPQNPEESMYVYAYLNDAVTAQQAAGVAKSLPVPLEKPMQEEELDHRAGQLQVRVFAAVPKSVDVSSKGPIEEANTTLYQVKLWVTRKVVVGAIVDVANKALSKAANGAVFGKEEGVCSYFLGEDSLGLPDSPKPPHLDFELSDEIEDLEGFKEHSSDLQFIVYNRGESECNVENFWGSPAMVQRYQKEKVDFGSSVAAQHDVSYEVEDWAPLIAAHPQ